MSTGLTPGWARASDERLARMVAREGEAPFAELYARYHQPLYRYCRSIVRDEHDAQDALQCAMASAFAALSSGERDLAVRPWLFRIAHNESVSLLRRRRPQETPMDEQALAAAANIAEPAAILEQRERLAVLLGDLRGLTIRQRSVLLMRELSGLSMQEIAAVCSSTPSAVKQTLFEVRTALRENEQGRSMQCEQVRRLLDEDDRRTLRGRRIRSHLDACAGCREMAEMISARRMDLLLLAPPLPTAAASALLARLLDTGAGVSAGAAFGASAGAGSGTQAAATGSTGVSGAAGGGSVGGAAASGATPGIAAHASGAIAAKVLTAAVLVAGGVAGITISGSAHHAASRAAPASDSRHRVATHHAVSRASQLGRDASAPPRDAPGVAKRTPPMSVRGGGAGAHPTVGRGHTGGQHGQELASQPVHGRSRTEGRSPPSRGARSRGQEKHETPAGHTPRPSGRPDRQRRAEGRSGEHRTSSPPRQGKRASHEAHAPNGRQAPKEAHTSQSGGKGHDKQPPSTSGASQSEAVSVEAPAGEHGKASVPGQRGAH